METRGNKKNGSVRKRFRKGTGWPVLPLLVCLGLVIFVITVVVNCENPVIKQWYESKEQQPVKPRPPAPPAPSEPGSPPGAPLPAGVFTAGSINLGVLPAFRDRYEVQGLWFKVPDGRTVRAMLHQDSPGVGRWETGEGVPNRGTVELRLPNGEVLNLPASGKPGSPDMALELIPIGSGEELAAIRRGGYPLDGHYLQYTGFDLGGFPNWEPTGSGGESFTGIYNGGGHPIRGLETAGTMSNLSVGLFGNLGAEGQLLNIRVTGGAVSGCHNLGGICGINEGGLISACSFQGRVSGLQNEKANAGGIVGVTLGGHIKDSTFEGELDNTGLVSGGITALATEGSSLRDCINRGTIQSELRAGGIVGFVKPREGGGGTGVLISGCRNRGVVKGKEKTGGIAGEADTIGIISACYNDGEITGEREIGGVTGRIINAIVTACRNDGTVKALNRAGGITGYGKNSEITACYNTGKIDGNSPAGGIAGVSENSTIFACYNTGQVGEADAEALAIVLSSVGWIAGEFNGPGENLQACYWGKNKPVALNGVGNPRSNQQAKQFNTGDNAPDDLWPGPATHPDWGIGEGGSNHWWKTLGYPGDPGNPPRYPTLYWE